SPMESGAIHVGRVADAGLDHEVLAILELWRPMVERGDPGDRRPCEQGQGRERRDPHGCASLRLQLEYEGHPARLVQLECQLDRLAANEDPLTTAENALSVPDDHGARLCREADLQGLAVNRVVRTDRHGIRLAAEADGPVALHGNSHPGPLYGTARELRQERGVGSDHREVAELDWLLHCGWWFGGGRVGGRRCGRRLPLESWTRSRTLLWHGLSQRGDGA